jgi:hypothetical protein
MLSFSPILQPKHMPKAPHLRITRPGYCRTVGGDESVSATATVRHRRTYSVGACPRGPGIAAGERAFRAMARSAVAMT